MSAHLGLAVTAFVDGELAHSQREEVLAHLLHCSPCRAEVAEARRYKAALRACEDPAVPFDLTARLLAVTVEVTPSTGEPSGRRLHRPHAPGRLVRRRAVRRSATAGALVALGLGGALSLGGPPPRAPVAPVDPTSSRFMLDHATTTGEVPFTDPDIVSVSSGSAP